MLQLQLDLDQPHLPQGTDSVRHLLARITPPAPDPTREVPPLDLAIVIDASGSMNGPPLAAATEATLRLARELPSSTRLTVVSFAHDIIVHADGLPLNQQGRREIQSNLLSLETRGATNLHAGWQTGCTLLAAETEHVTGRRKHVVVLSDGHANQGLQEPAALASESRLQLDQGISTSCVGIGDGYSPEQLAALADHGGGSCHDAENAGEIVEVLLGEALSLSEVVAENVKLALHVPEGIHARELSGIPSTFDGHDLVAAAGAVRAGVERTIVVRLEIPAGMDLQGLAFMAHLTWHAPGSSQQTRSPTTTATCQRVTGDIHPPPPEDARSVLLAWQANLVRRITALNRGGNFTGIDALWRSEFAPFMAYAKLTPETEQFADDMHKIRRRAARPMRERDRKVSVDIAGKYACQESAYYSKSKGGVADQFEDY